MSSTEAQPYCRDPMFEFSTGYCEEEGQVVASSTAGAVITSSGYWSVYRSRPAYQSRAVDAYLSTVEAPCRTESNGGNGSVHNVTSPCPFAHASGSCRLTELLANKRGSSDVATPGHNYLISIGGQGRVMDGTSASVPAFAAVVSLLNAEQLRRGQPPMGSLNAWLYKTHARDPSCFADVVVGEMDATSLSRCPLGFHAAPGWDPASGLGVPNFEIV